MDIISNPPQEKHFYRLFFKFNNSFIHFSLLFYYYFAELISLSLSFLVLSTSADI